MRKICLLILMFLSISCEKTNKKSSIEENLIKKDKSPLFLSLSPHMTDKDFNDEISSLNISKKLNSGHFTVKEKDDEYYFRVYKEKNSIWLNADNRSNFIYTDCKEYERKKEEVYNKIKVFVEKIEEKYKDKKNESLTSMFFEDLSLEKGNFGVYRDSYKTITIQYNIDYDEYHSEQYIRDNYKSFYTDESGHIVRSSIVLITINIYYYYNSDFDKLLKERKHNKIITQQNVIKELNKKAEISKKLENNLDDL